MTARIFDGEEQAESSTAREMRGILFAIESFEPYVKGKRVLLQCDNKGSVAISRKGSPKPDLNRLAIRLAEKCASVRCELECNLGAEGTKLPSR